MNRYLASFLFLPFAVVAAETNDLPLLVPAYGELPLTFWEQHQATIIIAGFAFFAFVFLFIKTMLRPESPKILPPEMVAQEALARLQDRPEDGNVLSGVSQILRRYVSETFSLSNGELTTAEFCAAIEVSPQIGSELAGEVSGFLRECDVRKFSPAGGTAPVNAVSRALEIVARIEKETHRQDACATAK